MEEVFTPWSDSCTRCYEPIERHVLQCLFTLHSHTTSSSTHYSRTTLVNMSLYLIPAWKEHPFCNCDQRVWSVSKVGHVFGVEHIWKEMLVLS
jgi:hypothetical protein